MCSCPNKKINNALKLKIFFIAIKFNILLNFLIILAPSPVFVHKLLSRNDQNFYFNRYCDS